jgi:hypothetical protein
MLCAHTDPSIVQVNTSARGSVSLISLVPDEVLAMYAGSSLQDIELKVVNVDDDDSEDDDDTDTETESLDYYALVKDAAEIAPFYCNGKSSNRRMVIQVNASTLCI